MLLTLVIFGATSACIVLMWNRFFAPVPAQIALVLWLLVAMYQAGTLFTGKVDVPGNLAFVAYPWKALDRPPAKANTGIIFTQILPWTRVARDMVREGNFPSWNRTSGSGAPLLANQQTAIFHPFTLLGLFLSIGKASTLSASLRLYSVLFFTFVFLRQWRIGMGAAFFGAVAYTFCSFHVVWLLFPLGLATMMLPACLSGVGELASRSRPAAYCFLTLALALTVLGGHPESALWVWLVTVAYALYVCLTATDAIPTRWRSLAVIASAFVIAMLLTAFFWLPTLRLLPLTSRFQAMHSLQANPANHRLSAEWLLPILTPNVLGTPVNDTYVPPRGSHPAVLNDYGEVASSYAGLLTLAAALAAPFVAPRRRPLAFAIGLMLFAFLTINEIPGWRDVIRSLPLAGVSLHQRLRVVWNLGVCIAAALTLDSLAGRRSRVAFTLTLVGTGVSALVIYGLRRPAFVWSDKLSLAQLLVPIATVFLLASLTTRVKSLAGVATALVFLDLTIATYRYNPPVRQKDLYPVTGAIDYLRRQARPFRMVAAGWSFLSDTPGFYGIEDVKTTDPVQHPAYMRLLRGYLNIDPASYDLEVRDFSQPFFDYLGIRYVYAPPGQEVKEPRFVQRYRGLDGTVAENVRVLPRYFFVQKYLVASTFDQAVAESKKIKDFRERALVDHVPQGVPTPCGDPAVCPAGSISLVRYGENQTELEAMSTAWNLLVTSDVNWPGWSVHVNGRWQPLVTVNGAFVGAFIPPGRSRILLRYRPDGFEAGRRCFWLGLLLLVGTVGLWCFRSCDVPRGWTEEEPA